MTVINPYLTFLGDCEAAFNYYKLVFGGEFSSLERFSEMPQEKDVILSEDEQNKILHIALPLGKDNVLMGSDAGGHRDAKTVIGNNISISVSVESKDRAEEVFEKLSENGAVAMPMEDTYWGEYFGMCTDQFGINWMVSFNPSEEN